MAEEYAGVAGAEQAGGHGVVFFAEGEDLTADDSGEAGPAEEAQ